MISNLLVIKKTSFRKISQLNEDDYTIEKIRQKAEQNLINIKNEEVKMQQIREEHKQPQIKRDILTNISKNQIPHNINLTEFENNTLIYVYALKGIKTRYGLNYTIIGSLSDLLNEQLIHFNSGPMLT